MSRYPQFDRAALVQQDISLRGHDCRAADCALTRPATPPCLDGLTDIVHAMRKSRLANRPIVLMMGAHLIKLGLSPYIVDLMRHGWISHVAMNGAGIIHDFELAREGGTSEDVAKWIKVGQFGLWHQTGLLNDVIRDAALRNEGLGEGTGRFIHEQNFPHAKLSIAAAGWKAGVPVTCHVTVGGDIIHAHHNCDGAALGQTSYTDFLIFAQSIAQLAGGVFLNIGSAVTGPEVFLKALSMGRNVARLEGRSITQFTTGVFDLTALPVDWRKRLPSKDEAGYYFRPWKTVLDRTVSDGGHSFYVQGDHRQTIPALWDALVGAN